MNWRRGLFRLWIVGSALFVLAIAFISYTDIKTQFDDTALQRYFEAHSELVVPQLCGDARGVADTDYSVQRYRGLRPEDPYTGARREREAREAQPFDICWYAMSKFRLLYPEYKDVSDKELSRKLYAEHDLPIRIRDLPNPWATLGTAAAIAFGIPLVVLALGASLVWAFSGFAANRKS